MASPAVEAGAAAVGTGTGTASTQNFTLPSGTQVGDTVCIYCVAAANVTFSATNFTAQAVTTGGSAPFGQLLTHAYDGTEGWTPGTTTITVTKSSTAAAWVGVIFSLLGTFDPALSGSGVRSAGSTSMAIAGVTTTKNGDLIIWIACNTTASGVTPGTITPPTGYTSITGQVSSTNSTHANSGLLIATNTQTTAGATGTLTGTDSAGQAYAGLVIGLAGTGATAVSLSGGLSFTGSTTRTVSRALPAGLSFTGSIKKAATRGLSGGLSFAGSMGRSMTRPITGGLSFTGTLARAASRGLGGGLSFAGTTARSVGRALSGGLSFSGAVASARVRFVALTGGLSFTGSLGRGIARPVAGGLSFAGSLSRSSQRALSATVSFAGSLAKSTSRKLSGGLSFVSSTARGTSRSLSGGLSFSGAIASLRTRFVALTGGLSFTGTLNRGVGRSLSGGLSFTGSLRRAVQRALSATLSYAGSLTRSTSRSLSGGLSFAGSVTRGIVRRISGGLSFAGSMGRSVNKSLNGGLSFAGAVTRSIGRSLGGALSFTGGITRRIGRALAGLLGLRGTVTPSAPGVTVATVPTAVLVLQIDPANTGTASLELQLVAHVLHIDLDNETGAVRDSLDTTTQNAVAPVSAGPLVIGAPGPHLPLIVRTQPSWRTQVVTPAPVQEGIMVMLDTTDTVTGTDALLLSIGYGGNDSPSPASAGPLIVTPAPSYVAEQTIIPPGGIPAAVAVHLVG